MNEIEVRFYLFLVLILSIEILLFRLYQHVVGRRANIQRFLLLQKNVLESIFNFLKSVFLSLKACLEYLDREHRKHCQKVAQRQDFWYQNEQPDDFRQINARKYNYQFDAHQQRYRCKACTSCDCRFRCQACTSCDCRFKCRFRCKACTSCDCRFRCQACTRCNCRFERYWNE